MGNEREGVDWSKRKKKVNEWGTDKSEEYGNNGICERGVKEGKMKGSSNDPCQGYRI
jgi:hypothetical protein